MTFYVVQHGDALSGEIDPERPLSDTGRSDVVRIAEVAKAYGVTVSEIVHSGKMRARETAEIFQEYLCSENGIREVAFVNPKDSVDHAVDLINQKDGVMIVGHLPHLERLVSQLVSGDPDHPVFKLQNGGVLCVDKIFSGDRFTIKWGLMPHVGS